jgi:hypothetical protein
MARRSQRYTLNVGTDQDFELTTPEWNELLAAGWIERTGYKTARPRRGVVAWVRGGLLFVIPFARMSCVTARWFLIWLFEVTVISAAYVGETVSKRQERMLFERERERQNEALIWCSRRGKKGANEYRWMTSKQKTEIFRALKPEMLCEATG